MNEEYEEYEPTIDGGYEQVWDTYVGGQTPEDFVKSAYQENAHYIDKPTLSEIVFAYVAELPTMFSDWADGNPITLCIRCTDGRHGYLTELLTEYIVDNVAESLYT